MTWRQVSRGNFGLGRARVIVEITAPDGTISRVVVGAVQLVDTEDSKFILSEKINEEITGRPNKVTLSTEGIDRHVCIELAGEILPDENGQQWTVRIGADPVEVPPGG